MFELVLLFSCTNMTIVIDLSICVSRAARQTTTDHDVFSCMSAFTSNNKTNVFARLQVIPLLLNKQYTVLGLGTALPNPTIKIYFFL